MYELFKRIIYKIARRKFVRGFDRFLSKKRGRALLYYKTEEFFLRGVMSNLAHPNNWESFQMAKTLNELGFIVDIIDRTATLRDVEKLEDDYDLFIGLGAGDSGKHFIDIAKRLASATRVLYAMGPEPDLSNIITKKRHEEFLERFPGNEIVYRRLINDVDINESMKHTEAIITCCNGWGIKGYEKFGKQIERVWLSSHPSLVTNEEEISHKEQDKFLYFGGNGNIMKGLPLAIEAFSHLPNLTLYIGAPTTEEDFNRIMAPMISRSPNIHFVGFMNVTGADFTRISKECGYVILPSSSEGCATSVTTCMRRGLIPVVTEETGVDIRDFGYLLESIRMDYLVQRFDEIAKESREEFLRRSMATYIDSGKYTRENFTKTFTQAVSNIMTSNGL